MVGVALEAPPTLSGYFDTARSPLNPRNRGFPFFVYGTLPLLLVRGLASLLGLADAAHLHLVGRVLAALFDLATVLLTWGLGRALAGPRVGVAAAALMALCVASIQHAHFFTVDAFAACFGAGALLAAARLAAGGGPGAQLAFGACLAAAAACRINLVLLAPLYPAAIGAALWSGATTAKRAAAGAALAVATSLVVFRAAQAKSRRGRAVTTPVKASRALVAPPACPKLPCPTASSDRR